MTTTLAEPAAVARPDSGRSMPYGVAVVVLLAALVVALFQTLVVPSLSEIGQHFHSTPSAAAWTLTGFLLSASVAAPLVGKLGDLYGKGQMLSLVLAVMAAGSLVSALAGSIAVVIVGRVIQGVAGGVFPLAFGIVRDTFPRERVGMGISLVSATFGIGAAIGLPLGGVIVTDAGVASLFWVGLIAAPLAVGAAVLVHTGARSGRAAGALDWRGAALLSAALVALLLAVSQASSWGWDSPPVIGLLAGGIVLLAVWALVERRMPEPLVDMRVLARRPVWLTNLAALLIGFALFGAFVMVPEFLETPARLGYGFGSTITTAGLLVLPTGAAMVVVSPLADDTIAHAPIPHAAAYTAAFLVTGAAGLVAALVTLGLPRRGARPVPAGTADHA